VQYWVIEASKDGVTLPREEHVPILVQGSRETVKTLVAEVQNCTPYGWYADVVPRPLTRDQLVELFVA
jgi:hypothetical protein